MAYDNHKFCWHALVVPDISEARSFYSKAVGWGIQSGEMEGEQMFMFAAADGEPRGHFMEPPMPQIPAHIASYIRVEDVDATLAACLENGGEQRHPATDIPPGRFATVASPSGAVFHLFQESDEEMKNPGGGPGSIHWVELHSSNVDTDVTWLISTFGFNTKEMEIPNGTYYMLLQDDEPIGGVTPTVDPEMHSLWMVWIAVPDVDACVKRIEEHGGKAQEPNDYPGVGRMAMARDNQGVVFGVITPD